MKSALWQAVKKAQPNLTDKQVDDLLAHSASQERLHVLSGLSLEKARELANEELFPPNVDPWAGDEKYGPLR